MRNQSLRGIALGLVSSLALALSPAVAPAMAVSEIPAGTRFMVELSDKLDAAKIHQGKKFEARTLEALQVSDGSLIPAGAKLKGRVSYVEDKKMMLRFERIETKRGKFPIIASVVQVQGEKDVDHKAGEEGEIRASGSNRGKNAAIGAAVAGGIGAAVGAQQGGAKGAAIGAGTGAAVGAIIGAAAGGKDLVLEEGARLELQLDRPLVVESR